jgi:hypothetical protein
MTMGDSMEIRDKVIRLEAQVEHLTTTVDHMAGKLDDLHEVFLQAKGARWLLMAMAGIGGALAGFAAKWVPFITAAPR